MRVYLHIGFGKTGTTSIQDYLFFNREIRKSDFIYPEIGLRGSGHHNLATLGKDEFSDVEMEIQHPPRDNFYRRGFELHNHVPHAHYVMSVR